MADLNRAKALRDALLEFLYEQRDERDNRTALPTAFVGTREAAAFNPAPTVDELTGAAAFLDEEGYINGTQAASGDFILVFLTPRGMRAVEEGHLSGPRPVASPVVNNLTISGSNSGVIAQGRSVTQNIGLSADQVAELLADVREAIAGLGDRDREEAEVLADILEEELTEEQPRPSKVKRIGARLAVLLGEAAAAGSIEALVSGIIG